MSGVGIFSGLLSGGLLSVIQQDRPTATVNNDAMLCMKNAQLKKRCQPEYYSFVSLADTFNFSWLQVTLDDKIA